MTADRLLMLAIAGSLAASAWLGYRLYRARRLRRAVLFALGLLCLGALVWARFVEPYWIETTTTEVTWKGPPLRVVLLADLHAGRTLGPQIKETVERANAARPDVVILAGDYVTGFDADPAKLALLDELKALAPRMGTFAVLGNHDTEPVGSEESRAAAITHHLASLGVVVLRNAWRTVGGVTIVGLGDHDAHDDDAHAAFDRAPEGATLLVAHNPASIVRGDASRFEIALAAHTHGGQICVPLLRYCPVRHHEADPYLAGLYTLPSGAKLYVTRGIGESGVKARFACRPEIAILDLVSAAPSASHSARTSRSTFTASSIDP